MAERSPSRSSGGLPFWAKIVTRLVLVLCAVGSYYLWHGAFGIPSAPSVIAAIVIWTPVA